MDIILKFCAYSNRNRDDRFDETRTLRGVDGIRGDHARTAALEEGVEDTRLPGRLGEGARIGVPVRRDGQRRDPQTGDDRLRRASDEIGRAHV